MHHANWGDEGAWRSESYLSNAFTAASNQMGGVMPVRISSEFGRAAAGDVSADAYTARAPASQKPTAPTP